MLQIIVLWYPHFVWYRSTWGNVGLSKAIVFNTKLNKVFKLARNRFFRPEILHFIRTLCCSTQPHLYANESCLESWGKASS